MVRELLRPLLRYLALPGATEIVVNRPQEVYIEIGATWQHHLAPDLTLDRLTALATAIATATEQEIGPHHPILSAMLPDGERVQIVLPPAVELGTVSISIRRPSAWIKTLDEYDAEGAFNRYVWAKAVTLDDRAAELDPVEHQLADYLSTRQLSSFIRTAVRAKKNIAVVGDTGSGKTTLMKSICQAVPEQERLITIEDVRELLLPKHGNRVHLLYAKGGQGAATVTPAELIASTLRMKPDRVLLAELRGRSVRLPEAPHHRPQWIDHLLSRGVLRPRGRTLCLHVQRARTGGDLRCANPQAPGGLDHRRDSPCGRTESL